MSIWPSLTLYPGAADAYPGYYTRAATYGGNPVMTNGGTTVATYAGTPTFTYEPTD